MDTKTIGVIVISVVVTALIVYFVIPTKTVTVQHSITQADTGKNANEQVAAAIKKYEDAQKEIGWLKRLLQLAKIQNPTGGAVSNPSTPPIPGIPVPKDSAAKAPVLHAYDFPLSMKATKSKIIFLTINPFLQYYDLPYVKTYEFDRTTSDFEFALSQTQDSHTLNGMVFKSNERFFSFDGMVKL